MGSLPSGEAALLKIFFEKPFTLRSGFVKGRASIADRLVFWAARESRLPPFRPQAALKRPSQSRMYDRRFGRHY